MLSILLSSRSMILRARFDSI